jgi:hypothetical protein
VANAGTAQTARRRARPGTPDELAAFIAGEIPKWQALAKLTGVTGE